ncbi:hypothetical protein ACFCX4_17125 [Kitasatospora sp. NPDC056327]|uniref:hypothetical protein n=1 Tax=Kitasatospora sp. NPDC056327 TaxID=3345785 RepID=UPI0035DB543F
MASTTVTSLAHLVGHGSGPIPRTLALIAGTTALYASFDALRLRWHEPRFDARRSWRTLPAALTRVVDHPMTRRTLQTWGAALAFLTLAVLTNGYGGEDLGLGMVFVLFWVGLVPASLLLGPVWRLVNPLRSLHALLCAALRVPPTEGLRPLPAHLGRRPAALGLLAFGWLELAAPGRDSAGTVLVWLWLYAAVQLICATVYGDRWFEHGDAFEVYSTLLAAMSPLGRAAGPDTAAGPAGDRPGKGGRPLVLRNPFDALASVRPGPGLEVLVSVLLALTAFDGFANTGLWRSLAEGLPQSPVRTAGLLAAVAVMLGLLRLSGWAARRLSPGTGWSSAAMAPSLLPVAAGYVLAHYASVLVTEVQRFADVFLVTGEPAAVHHGGAAATAYALPAALVVSLFQVAFVVTGHVVAVVAAHDGAVGALPARRRVLPQVPLFAAMLALTLGALTLLLNA